MKPSLPKTDSVHELAAFWDTHDVTDFDGELMEVASPFARSVAVPLSGGERVELKRLAAARGLSEAQLLHEWVAERLHKP